MATKKTTGKKLADMMYGNPEGAAFGITPMIGKRREDRQDREAAKNFPVDLGRGVLAGALGVFGDMESVARLPYELITGNESPTFLPTSEDVLKRIPFGSDSPASQFASGIGTIAGGFAPVGPAYRAVKALPGALKTVARNVSAPRTLDPQAGVVRVGRPSAPQEKALRLAQKRAALPIEQGGLGLPAKNTPEQRAKAMGINTDAYHGTKQDITGAFRPGYDDNLAFVTKSPDFANKWIGKGKLQQRSGEQAQQEVKSAEDAYRNIKLQTMHHDDALERLTGEEFNKEYDLRSAIARAEAEKEFGSPGYPDKIHSTVYPLKVEANRTFNPETDMDVMAEFFEKNEIPPKLQDLYASGNYMMYETKPVVEFLKSKGYDSMRLRESTGDDYPTIAVFNPETTRSRFAAFDPFRKDVATAAAMGALAPDLLAEEAPSRPVHFSDNPDVMQLELAGGGLVKGIKAAAKAVKGTQEVLPAVEREANKAKFLEPSKVKDRMYHATNADFKSFRRNHRGAQFVTPDRDFANQHIGDDAFTGAVENFEEGANIMPVHVQVKKPFDYENLQDVKNLFRQAQKDRIPLDRDWKQGILEGNWDSLENEKIMRSIQDLGYDAMFVSERDYTGEPIKNLGIFDPRKIKSETGNRGTYDIEDPDITKAEGGAVRMQAGGLVRGIKALKAAKEPAQAPMKASEALGRIEGRPLVITQSDRTKVGGGFLGGPGFSGLQLTEPEYRAAEAVWGVKTPGVAKMILGGGKKAGADPVYTTFIGTPNQHQSNQMVFDKLLGDFRKSARKGGLDPELQEKINYRLANAVDKDGRPIFPPDVNILDKNFRDLATTFDQRAVTSSLIGGLGVGGKKGQIVDYDKIIRNTTDPALLDAPSGALGNRLFTLSGGIIDRPDLHPAFPTILQGEDLGVSFEPVIRDLVMKDFIEKTMREKGRPPGYMDYTRGHPPSQLITEDILTEMQKLGKKAGGAVRKAAGGEITADDLILEERKL